MNPIILFVIRRAGPFQLPLKYWLSGLDSISPHLAPYSPVEVTEVKVPLYGVEGKQVVLRCVYNSLQPVYSVKWYVPVVVEEVVVELVTSYLTPLF